MASLPPISRSFSSKFHATQEGFRNLSRKPVSVFPAKERIKLNKRVHSSKEVDHGGKTECFHGNQAPEMINGCERRLSSKEVLLPTLYASESDSTGNHHRSLQTYLEKLQSHAKQAPLDSGSDVIKPDDRSSQARKELRALDSYLGTLVQDAKLETSTSGRNMSNVTRDFATGDIESVKTRQQKGFSGPRYKRSDIYASSQLYGEKDSGNLYLISLLLAINIAVFIFEIASPIKSSDYNLYTLPLMYGAKVNDLIMLGEWWRLFTPMFLVQRLTICIQELLALHFAHGCSFLLDPKSAKDMVPSHSS